MVSSAGALVLQDMRVQQARLAAQSAATAIAIWPFLQKDQGRWLSLLLGLVRRDRRLSAELARRYLTAYRVVERAPGVFEFAPVGDINEEQIISSMLYTGPQELERARQRAGLEVTPYSGAIARKIMESNARAVQRHVTNGGREVVDDVLRRDPARPGYMRLTDGDPCFFCAMLASRGPVYEDDSFEDSDPRFSGAGDHKVHDGCGCTLIPIYGSGAVALQQFKSYERLWASATQGRSGRAAVNAFRREYEAQRRVRA